MTCVSISFSIDVNIFSRKFKSFVKDETKIERFSNIAKNSFNNLLININKIKNIFVYYQNDVNKIKTCF